MRSSNGMSMASPRPRPAAVPARQATIHRPGPEFKGSPATAPGAGAPGAVNAKDLLVDDIRGLVLAVRAVRVGAVLGRLLAGVVADVLLADDDLLVRVTLDRHVGERGRVAVVGVD